MERSPRHETRKRVAAHRNLDIGRLKTDISYQMRGCPLQEYLMKNVAKCVEKPDKNGRILRFVRGSLRPLIGSQNPLPQTDAFRGYFHQFVVIYELDCLLES